MRISWYAQNEKTDEDGFLLDGEPCFEAEMRILREDGAPDTEKVVFVDWEADGRDESVLTADASEAFAAWLRAEGITTFDEDGEPSD